MSHALINRSPDLKRLRDEGYVIEVKDSHLFMYDVPYVNSQKKVAIGTLVAPLSISMNKASRPHNHVIHFIGTDPCDSDGKIITAIKHNQRDHRISGNILANRSFSNKPKGGYQDFYEKFTTYAAVISHPAKDIDASVTAQTHRLVEDQESDDVFCYMDTNSSRNGTMSLTDKFRDQSVGIIGLGGTGSYILDAIAKTPLKAIHLFDDDDFNSHNAFRTPGAASLEEVNSGLSKVQYLADRYSAMHRNILPHEIRIVKSTLDRLADLDFVFVAIDSGEHKRIIFTYLNEANIPFVDVGIGVQWNHQRTSLRGTVRTTFGSQDSYEHLDDVISYAPDDKNLYDDNIQIAELNGLNAYFAVIKWKQHLGVYQKEDYANHTVLTINDSNTINDF